MNLKFILLLLACTCVAFANGASSRVAAQNSNYSDVEPKLVSLLSQIKHDEPAKANVNFKLGVRGDSDSPATKNVYDLRYGGYANDKDLDWLEVPIAHGSSSQIKDLGELDWTEIYDTPFLYAGPVPHDGKRSEFYKNGKVIKSLPENTLVKAVVGHMYVVHTRGTDRDFYVMFRVVALKSGDEVTISWRIVPSPENN
ncbi:MAG TPA: hypothetical protein VGO68_16920 [Pyrinomonadaceae bacterium]|jgi:hypothetical protein|nr:hypothetical protein [Pyrinomonadaceae bacterium]